MDVRLKLGKTWGPPTRERPLILEEVCKIVGSHKFVLSLDST